MSTKRIPANGALLRAARLELQLGTREIARNANSSFTSINFIEKTNAINSAMTLAEANKIASAAGLSLTDLLTPPRSHASPRLLVKPHETRKSAHLEPTDPDEQHPASDPQADARTLAQILIQDPRVTEKVAICRALGWTLPRLRTAHELLDEFLNPMGLRVHTVLDGMCLRPVDAEAHPVMDLVSQQTATVRGLNLTAARMLRDAIIANVPDEIRDGEKPAVGMLTRQSILKPGEAGQPSTVPTEDALFAFDISGVTHEDLPVEATWKSKTTGGSGTARKDFVTGGPGKRRPKVESQRATEPPDTAPSS